MDSYILHAHGSEELCEPTIVLYPGENVIMACNDGCVLEIKSLSEEFMNKHLLRTKSPERFFELIKNPELVGKKYKNLTKFFNDIMCNFTSEVPELKLTMYDHHHKFTGGVFKSPVYLKHKWSKLAKGGIVHGQYDAYEDDNCQVHLSQVIKDIRLSSPNGFILLIAACRSFTYKPPSGTRVASTTLSLPITDPFSGKIRGTLVPCVKMAINNIKRDLGSLDYEYLSKAIVTRSYWEINSLVHEFYYFSDIDGVNATVNTIKAIICIKDLSELMHTHNISTYFLKEYLENIENPFLDDLLDQYGISDSMVRKKLIKLLE